MNTLPAADFSASIVKKHWNAIRAGRIAPFRSEIDPNAVSGVLENLFILERIGPGDHRIRVAGTQVCDFKGMEVRGLPFASFVHRKDRGRLSGVIEMVLNCPAAAEVRLGGVDGGDRPVSADILLLPLRSDFGEMSRVIGCMTVRQQEFSCPIELKIFDVEVESVVISENGRTEHPLPGFYDPAREFSCQEEAASRSVLGGNPGSGRVMTERRPLLRLVHDRSNPNIRPPNTPGAPEAP